MFLSQFEFYKSGGEGLYKPKPPIKEKEEKPLKRLAEKSDTDLEREHERERKRRRDEVKETEKKRPEIREWDRDKIRQSASRSRSEFAIHINLLQKYQCYQLAPI